jgi:alpha-tubulin suppressor-like RCC1 family protein
MLVGLAALALTATAGGVSTAQPPARIAAGFAHTCVLTSAGGVKCWGGNAYGELGNGGGPLDLAYTAVSVTGLGRGIREITAGAQHTCALTSAGAVKCWGDSRLGQLGSRATPNGRTPVPVAAAGLKSGIRAIAGGGQHTCALTSAGGAKCWGANGQGALGNGSRTPSVTPLDAADLTSGVAAITAGDYHTCALTSGGGVKCWG